MTEAWSVPVAEISRILSRAHVANMLVTFDGQIRAANDAAAHLVGLPVASAIVGRPIFERTPEEQARHRLSDIAKGIVEAAHARIEVSTVTGDRRTLTAWWRRLPTDEGPHALVVLTPVELVVARSGTAPPAGWLSLVTTDHDWRIVDLSADAERLVGPSEQLVGQGVLGFVHPLDLSECVGALALLGDTVRTVTANVRFRAGDRWLPLVVTVARLCRHDPPRLVCLFAGRPAASDVTPEQHLDSLLQQRESGELLAHVGQALDRLATSHDLSAQQVEVIARSVRGEGPRKIAHSMHMSEGTVRNMLTGLYRKFDVHTQLELVSAVLLAG